MDVSKEAEVKLVYSEVAKEFGRLDASVNNAGIAGSDKPTHELTEKDWDAVMNVNQLQRENFFQTILSHFKGDLKGKSIAVWGLAFKPNTDDIREAPALYLIEKFLEAGANVRTYDPEAINNVKQIFGDKVYFAKDKDDALVGTDFLVIVTEWNEFRSPDFDKITSSLKEKLIFDGRNLYSLSHVKELGYTYYSIGREIVKP